MGHRLRTIEAGLFIGVPGHGDRKLLAATKDANDWSHAFQSILPGAPWMVVTSNHETSAGPTKLEILKAAKQWLHQLRGIDAAIVTFSGHCATSSSGLTLIAADTDESFLEDTGLSVQRLADLLTEELPNLHFLIVIDGCRTGISRRTSEKLPVNTCLMTAVDEGEVALESNSGGLCTHSLLKALQELSEETDLLSVSLKVWLNRARSLAMFRRRSYRHSLRLVGHAADQISVPLAESTRLPQAHSVPRCSLEYTLSLTACRTVSDQLLRELSRVYGVDARDERVQKFLQEHYSIQLKKTDFPPKSSKLSPSPELAELRFELPPGSPTTSASEILEQMLMLRQSEIAVLTLRWNSQLPQASLESVKLLIPGAEWEEHQQFGRWLSWRQGDGNGYEYSGRLIVLPPSSSTEIIVQCTTTIPKPELAPLRYLLPSLRDIYDFLRILHTQT